MDLEAEIDDVTAHQGSRKIAKHYQKLTRDIRNNTTQSQRLHEPADLVFYPPEL